MRIAETKVFSFDELSEDAKQYAIDKYRENDDMPFLGEDLEYHLEETLKQYKIKFNELPKIYYSLSYCQGDGAMFEGTVFWKSYEVTVKQSGHYYHYNSKDIYVESAKTGREASEDKHNEFNDLYVAICQDLAQYGYGCIEEQQGDENISDLLRVNEYEFTQEGRRW